MHHFVSSKFSASLGAAVKSKKYFHPAQFMKLEKMSIIQFQDAIFSKKLREQWQGVQIEKAIGCTY